jgi:hypothetical protein
MARNFSSDLEMLVENHIRETSATFLEVAQVLLELVRRLERADECDVSDDCGDVSSEVH